MKKNLLLLIAGLLWLSTAHTQLLTPIPDSTNYTEPETTTSDYYILGGYSINVNTGYQQMHDFFERQGFDVSWGQEIWRLGAGTRQWDRFYFDLEVGQSFDNNNTENVELFNSHVLSLRRKQTNLHFMLGYQFWQKRHKSLIFHTGISLLQNRVEITERRPQDFDFNTANIEVPTGVRSWPEMLHRQGALHLALQIKLRYPRPRWWSREVDLKFGFVSSINTKAWSVNPGQGLNVPNDRAQYFYMSSAYYFFSKQQ
ncbi:MAG: hypothetical protein AAGJ93_06405 [Bacteroidota bacterium]